MKVGQRVHFTHFGSWSDYVVVDSSVDIVLPIPDNVRYSIKCYIFIGDKLFVLIQIYVKLFRGKPVNGEPCDHGPIGTRTEDCVEQWRVPPSVWRGIFEWPLCYSVCQGKRDMEKTREKQERRERSE